MQPRIHRRTEPYPGAPTPGVPTRVDDDVEPQRIQMPNALRPGDRIGRYVIRNRLGRGGMGVVWGAYDPVLGRRVAIKLVRHRDTVESAEAQVDERLRREAQALARLSHPNVVSLYDVGTCPHGDYLALELVPGVDLEQWLRTKTRSWQAIVEVFVPAGRGLAAAHHAGLIHRDFKPANVIVGPQGHVTVVDFGLARSAELDTTLGTSERGSELDAADADDDDADADDGTKPAPTTGTPHGRVSGDSVKILLSARLTGTDMIVGTRGYMAPEQLMGLTVGTHADQFAFCVALFEALYGVRPYPGKNAIETATSFAEGRIVDPSDRRGVPRKLHAVLLRGLEIEADDRYPTMDALLHALRSAMPASARPRLRWLAALATTAALSGGIGAMMHATLSEPEPAPVPEVLRHAVESPPAFIEAAGTGALDDAREGNAILEP
ncbi:serine/threonine-protein kinase [Paraliomyxa miuraensis]|uniref:serine/threonine-protein kinase n=1 Tax=Paraliomyxa miuraensis TaxID=376150 RepID=UPI00224F79D7|nr:serine/threonine-protein kinase [Paraliomyxa miuraensis]MCX4243575.1 serine/threonine protein kinase [Paraliomyxa miuraensis]